MLRTRTMVGSGCLLMIIITGGFLLLLRSCLSKYDERSAKLPAIIYNDDTSAVICSVVAYDKTTSYSSGRGMTNKSVNTTYYLQTNDINSANKIKQQELKDHQDIKEWPLQILGASPGNVWIFVGELMAFHPGTLQKKADIEILEKMNPLLLHKFPKESRYYAFNAGDGNIYFTATDGIKWKLDTHTMLAAAQPESPGGDAYKQALDSIEALQTKNSARQDSVFEKYSRRPGEDYRANKISLDTYHRMQNHLMLIRAELNQEADRLRASHSRIQSEKMVNQHIKSTIGSLSQVNPGFTQMGTSLDTLNNQWLGVYNREELKELSQQIYFRRAPDETARRFIVKGKISVDKYYHPVLDTTRLIVAGNVEYLAGSLLLDKKTGRPFHLPGKNILLIHKDKIGKEGKILLSSIDASGQLLWTASTGMESWYDWQLQNNKLIIFGQNNANLSSGEANILLIINLSNGTISGYDYFSDSKLTRN